MYFDCKSKTNRETMKKRCHKKFTSLQYTNMETSLYDYIKISTFVKQENHGKNDKSLAVCVRKFLSLMNHMYVIMLIKRTDVKFIQDTSLADIYILTFFNIIGSFAYSFYCHKNDHYLTF